MEKAKRKEREFNLRRTEILEAAVKVFAAKGFHSASVAEIAAASGFAIGTLYQIFESKEQIYTAMLTDTSRMRVSEGKIRPISRSLSSTMAASTRAASENMRSVTRVAWVATTPRPTPGKM